MHLHSLQTGEQRAGYPSALRAELGVFSYPVATDASDDTIRVWDMRAIGSLYTIPTHLSNVSDIRFSHANDLHFNHSKPDVLMNGTDADKSKGTGALCGHCWT